MNCCQPSGRSGAVMEMAGTPGAMTCESFPTCTVREYAGSHARSFRQDTPAPAVTGPSLVTIARAAGRGCTSEVATAFYNRGLPCPPRGPTNGFPMPQTMKALVKRKPEQGIWMEEVPLPEVGPNEVLIKIEKTAICGTDLHIYKWDEWSQRTIKPGLTIGHEFVGRIVEIGPGVTGYKIGDRVSAEGHIVCGHCRNCRAGRQHLCPNTVGIGVNRNGAFAEYMSMPASNLWPIPDQIPSELAAFF